MAVPARHLGLVALLVLCGCSSPRLGGPWVAGVSDAVPAGAGHIILYVEEQVDPGIWFDIELDGKRAAKLYQETFVRLETFPGMHRVQVREYWTGEGAGKDFADIFLRPFSAPSDSSPESLHAGLRTGYDVSLSPQAAVFLRVRKDPAETVYVPCGGDNETTTMCQREHFPTVIEAILKEEAETRLVKLQESK
jgi:hypothetical protein